MDFIFVILSPIKFFVPSLMVMYFKKAVSVKFDLLRSPKRELVRHRKMLGLEFGPKKRSFFNEY
jgi:hypothetical protein